MRGILLAALTLLAAGAVLPGCAGARPSLKVLVVQSYDETWSWGVDIQKGAIEGLSRSDFREGRDYEMKIFYMDTKVTYTTPEQIKQRGEEALKLIERYRPDLVFTIDDNALRAVAVEHTTRYPEKRLPFIFSGVNTDPSIYEPIRDLDRPGGLITGALERIPYYDALATAKRLSPGAARIVLLADRSPSSDFVLSDFKARYLDSVKDSPLQVLASIQVRTFQEWQTAVTEYQTKADVLVILNYYQLLDGRGKVVPALEVVEWTVRHNRLPEMGLVTSQAGDGLLAAVGLSGYKTGVYVGGIGGEVLRGRDPGTIPIVDPGSIEVAFNLKRADALGVVIPAVELARADRVFGAAAKGR